MTVDFIAPLLLCVFVVAVLYSSVGHGGASGYIAVMALFSMAPDAFKPTALTLNILVASIATYSFMRAGHFSWRLFWPFAATSIPCSFIGGYLSLPLQIYKPLVGLVLLASAYRLLFHKNRESEIIKHPSTVAALAVGAGLGFLSGLTGVGGGIFLSPLLLILNWGRIREVSAVAALFILVNSMSGLLGHVSSLQFIPAAALFMAVAALSGGIFGSSLGSRQLPVAGVEKVLSLVLVIAGIKLLLV